MLHMVLFSWVWTISVSSSGDSTNYFVSLCLGGAFFFFKQNRNIFIATSAFCILSFHWEESGSVIFIFFQQVFIESSNIFTSAFFPTRWLRRVSSISFISWAPALLSTCWPYPVMSMSYFCRVSPELDTVLQMCPTESQQCPEKAKDDFPWSPGSAVTDTAPYRVPCPCQRGTLLSLLYLEDLQLFCGMLHILQLFSSLLHWFNLSWT